MEPLNQDTLIYLGVAFAIVATCYCIGDKLMEGHGNLVGLAVGVAASMYLYTHKDQIWPHAPTY